MDEIEADGRWPQRSWGLGLAGALIGWAVHALIDDGRWIFDSWGHPHEAWRTTLATWLVTGGLAFALTWTRRRLLWALGFAGLVGLVVGQVVALGGADWDILFGWRLFFAVLAVLIAAPFFQHARDRWTPGDRPAFDYPRLHRAAWTNAVLIFAALLFVGLVWLLAWLLAAMFGLAGLDVLSQLLGKPATFWVLSGGALGAGIGLLRERETILSALQRIVITIYAVMAPVVAVGFALFVLVLPFTGLHPLWQATKSTTPILITSAAVAVLLLNAVIADRPEDEPTNPVFSWAAAALVLVLPVFALVAATSTGLRIRQYGFTPDRLWGLTFTMIASVYAVAYVVSLLQGWRTSSRWMARIRQANVRLGLGLCGLGLLLSTPVVDFGGIAARDQVARLKAGRIAPAKFDWTALRFSFGPAGLAALKELARSPTPALSRPAAAALAATDRWSLRDRELPKASWPLGPRLRRPAGAPASDPALVAVIDKNGICTGPGRCFVRLENAAEALVIYEGGTAATAVDNTNDREGSAVLFRRGTKGWERSDYLAGGVQYGDKDRQQRWKDAFDRGDFAIKPVERRQLFVGGTADGDVIQ